jgi:hypothetical protein
MYNRRIREILVVLGVLMALVLSGCGSPDQPVSQSAAPPAAAPTAVALIASQPSADQLYIRTANGASGERLMIVDGVSGARERELPMGVVAPDWSALYTAKDSFAAGQHKTEVRAIDPKTGQTLHETMIAGAYALPVIGPRGSFGGLSPDGRWLVLEATPSQVAGRWQSSLVVLDTAFSKAPRYARFDGADSYRFDGINNSGDGLYLIQQLASAAQASYKVRFYDLNSGALDPNVVVAKGEADVMSGARQTAALAPDGEWLYSLYLNTEYGPFIHALNLTNRFAVCIDLPKDSKDDTEKQSSWSLAMSRNGKALYAVNRALNMVVDVDTSQLAIRRTAMIVAPAARVGPLDALARWLVPVAAAKSQVRAGAALSPDGKTLFMIGGQGVLAINTADLTLRSRYLANRTLMSIALSSDGTRLYAISTASNADGLNTITQLNPATGAMLSEAASDLSLMELLRVAAR